jgi:hypothetical protein
MCHELVVMYGFVIREIAPRLSLQIVRASVIGNPSSVNKFRNQRASVPACDKATYSASVDDRDGYSLALRFP